MITRCLTYSIVAAFAAAMAVVSALVAANSPISNGTIHTVEIRNLEFFPPELVIAPGDTVRWINRDFVPHTATAKDHSWDTGELGKDERRDVVFNSSMTLHYFCLFHPMMQVSIQIDRE